MKKLLLSALLLASAGIVFSGCNNGAYDADPLTNNSGIPNPNNTGNGNTAALGSIVGKFNGTQKTFQGFYTEFVDRAILGAKANGSTSLESFSINFAGYTGVGTYLLDNDSTDFVMGYSLQEVATGNLTAYGITAGNAHGTVVVTEDANNKMKGTFNGVLFRQQPDNANDSLVITDGSFYLNKQ